MWLLKDSGRLGEAETLIRRALYIDQSVLGSDHPDIATDLCCLAWLLMDMRRPNEAEPLFQKSLEIVQKRFGPNHPFVVRELRNLALFFIDTDRLDEAEGVLYQSLGILRDGQLRWMGTERKDIGALLETIKARKA